MWTGFPSIQARQDRGGGAADGVGRDRRFLPSTPKLLPSLLYADDRQKLRSSWHKILLMTLLQSVKFKSSR
jgi:hypothetical protein